MNTDDLRTEYFKRIPRLQEFLRSNYGENVRHEDLKAALDVLVDSLLESMVDDLDEVLFNPRFEMHQKLRSLIQGGSVFTGNREFSREKMAAVVAFLVGTLGALSKTRLNKLAFYSDFRNFSRNGRSITGSAYRHLPYGPVIDSYEDVIAGLESDSRITVSARETSFGNAEFISKGDNDSDFSVQLSEDEIETLKSVVEDFGHLDAAEISDVSHEEVAYRNTRTGELISYGFSDLLETRPDA